MAEATPQDRENAYKQALVTAKATIRQLIEENAELRRKDDLAVIGMACRFPGGANDPDRFWQLIREGGDAIREVPADRWSAADYVSADHTEAGKMYTARGGFLDHPVRDFDAAFFGIAPREARALDPQHRLLMEVAWEALEDACLDPQKLRHSRTAVFVGMSSDDYALSHRHSGEHERIDAYTILGSTLSTAAGRLSYFLGLQGPCLTLDTACSSALVGMHLACQSLRQKESDMAFVGGVNLILSPEVHICFSKLRAISPTGSCKTFDAAADGYARAEGCGFVLLKRLPDAIRDGNRILAVVKGSASNQDGRTSGLAAPNGSAQQAVIREALRNAGVKPAEVDYVEAHGTGTVLGDPIEVEALGSVYGAERQAPLKLGSVKTNIGHLEPVAGLAGFIKIVQSLRHGELPKSRNFNKPNPHIPWERLPVQVVAERTPWPRSDRPRMAGLSAFGFSGTNAHIIIAEAPHPAPRAEQPAAESHLLCLSAREEAGLRALATAHLAALSADGPDQPDLADWCHSANAGRHHWSSRLAAEGANRSELRRRLEAFLEGRTEPGMSTGRAEEEARPRIAFLFTGQGSQYVGMGQSLYAAQKLFRDCVDHCDAILQPLLGRSIRAAMFEGPAEELNRTALCQPALFVLEYALARLWLSLGVKPHAVMGHSVGEYVAACIAGVFSLEDGLRLIVERGRLMQALPEGGAMAAIAAPADQVAAAIAPHAGRLSIAAINGPRSCVISGDGDAVEDVLARMQADGIGSSRLTVSHAFHSHRLDPMLGGLERAAAGITLSAPRIRLISNLSGRVAGAEVTTARYWVDHARQSVAFAAGMQALQAEGVQHFIEIGPQATLLGMGRHCLPQAAAEAASWLPSLRQAQPDLQVLHRALGELYAKGAELDWAALPAGQDRRWTPVPHYPFQRRRYWMERPEPVKGGRGTTDTPAITAPEAGSLAARAGVRLDFTWQEVPRTAGGKPAAAAGGTWLILAEGGADALAAALTAAGRHAVTARLSRTFARTGAKSWTLDGDSEADYQRLLAEVACDGPVEGVVYLWPTRPIPDGPAREMGERPLLRALHLARALSGLPTPPRLWLVTEGATSAGGATPSSPFPALLWGFGRSLFLDQPSLKGGLVDLATGAAAPSPDALVRELLLPDGEDAVALRGTARFAARLLPSTTPLAGPVPVRPDGAYLITGGLGSIGVQVARHLAAAGAGALILVGRRAPDAAQVESLAALEAYGTRVLPVQADCTDEAALRGTLAWLEELGLTLRGVIHAAGSMTMRPVKEMGEAELQQVLAPKVEGGWTLHLLTQDLALDFTAYFSSVSAVLGTAKQCHYAAANAFLDALAEYRHGQGHRTLSINWGPWQGGGLARGETGRRAGETGFKPMAPSEAAELFGLALASDATRLVAAEADWARLKSVYEVRGPFPLLERLAGGAAAAAAATDSAIYKRLQAAAPKARFDLLMAFLQEQVRVVLQFEADVTPDPLQGFFDMGMDSLTAVEFKGRVEAQLPCLLAPSMAFDHPNLTALARHLLDRMFADGAAAPAAQPAPLPRPARPAEPSVDVSALSDSEIAHLIDDQLATLVGKGQAR